MTEEDKLHIANLKLEGVAQAWWDTQMDTFYLVLDLVVDLGDQPTTTPPPIGSWDAFCQALCNRFYPLGYHQNILGHWLQLHHLLGQLVQSYIEVFTKLHIQLQIQDP
jgi:hypothetical protein